MTGFLWLHLSLNAQRNGWKFVAIAESWGAKGFLAKYLGFYIALGLGTINTAFDIAYGIMGFYLFGVNIALTSLALIGRSPLVRPVLRETNRISNSISKWAATGGGGKSGSKGGRRCIIKMGFICM